MGRWSDKVLTKLESGLDDIREALQKMPDIPDITIEADYTGEVLDGQLPRNVVAQRIDITTDVTTSATWAHTVDSGDLTATIDEGVLEITAIGAESVVTITSTYLGVDVSRSFNVYLNIADPPDAESGTFTAFRNANESFNSTTYANVLNNGLTVDIEVGSTGEVDLTTDQMQIWSDYDGSFGPWDVLGKWQWWNGASWDDVGTESHSNPDHEFVGATLSYGTLRVGSASNPKTKTGLTTGNTESFRLVCKNASGTRVMYISGKATATSS